MHKRALLSVLTRARLAPCAAATRDGAAQVRGGACSTDGTAAAAQSDSVESVGAPITADDQTMTDRKQSHGHPP